MIYLTFFNQSFCIYNENDFTITDIKKNVLQKIIDDYATVEDDEIKYTRLTNQYRNQYGDFQITLDQDILIVIYNSQTIFDGTWNKDN